MAGDWIKWTKGLTRKSEVLSIARKLNVNRRVAAALCMEFWEWADDQTTDGHIQGATMADIDEAVGQPGFAGCLVDSQVGWLRVTDAGVTLPNFKRHNGDSAKSRALTNDRVKRFRNARCNADETEMKRRCNAPSSLLSSPVSSDPDVPDLPEPERAREVFLALDVTPIWEAYPAHRRVGKTKAFAAIREALESIADRGEADPRAWLLGRVAAFAASPAAVGKFVPYAANWFADGRYDDTPESWEKDRDDKPGPGTNQQVGPGGAYPDSGKPLPIFRGGRAGPAGGISASA